MFDIEGMKRAAISSFDPGEDHDELFDMAMIIGQLSVMYAITDLGKDPSIEAINSVLKSIGDGIIKTSVGYITGVFE